MVLAVKAFVLHGVFFVATWADAHFEMKIEGKAKSNFKNICHWWICFWCNSKRLKVEIFYFLKEKIFSS